MSKIVEQLLNGVELTKLVEEIGVEQGASTAFAELAKNLKKNEK